MLAVQVVLLVVASGVQVQVQEARGVSEAELSKLSAALRVAVAARTAGGVTLDLSCPRTGDCGLPDGAESSDILQIRALGVPTRIRVLAVRSTKGAERGHTIDLPRAESGWAEPLKALAEALFDPPAEPSPEPVGQAAAGTAAVPPPVSPKAPPAAPEPAVLPLPPAGQAQATAPDRFAPAWVPWVAMVGGAAAALAGAGFGLSSRNARKSALEARTHTPEEIDRLQGRAVGHGIAANVLFGTAIVAAGAGIALLLVD